MIDDRVADDIRLRRIVYNTTDGRTIGAWLTTPVDGLVERGIVRLPGYGGIHPDQVAHPRIERAAVLWACPRGIAELSLMGDIPAQPSRHVLHGIESRDQYVHGGDVEDVWCAVTALSVLEPAVAEAIHLWGASFGGGIGTIALAWDDRIRGAAFEVPSFGNHPARVRAGGSGSVAAVRARWEADPAVLDVLAYFDAATCARFVTVPTVVAPACEDPVVPVIGQWAVADSMGGPCRVVPLTRGHVEEDPRERARLDAIIRELFLRV